MKKLMIVVSSLMLVGAFACPSMADVDVTATIDKDKDKFVDEFVFIDKDVFVDVFVDLWTEQGAEAEAIVNQKNSYNIDASACNIDINSLTDPALNSSVLFNDGIVGVNQSAGNLNNQGNVVSLAAVGTPEFTPPPTVLQSDRFAFGRAFAHAEASVEQENTGWNLELQLGIASINTLRDSVSNNSGIVGINQSSGNLNNQANAVALAAGLDGAAVAMAESDLGQHNCGNLMIDLATVKTDLIANSINSNQGVVGVNQSAGSLNNQANVVSIAFTP